MSNNLYKIIVFGDLPIATKLVEDLISRNDVDLLGVVTTMNGLKNVDPWPDPLLRDFSSKNNIRQIRLNDLPNIFKENEIDLGFTCRYSKIIKPNIIKLFKEGIINFHGGILPERAGVNTVCHSILLNDEFAGGTLHYVEEGIDTGDIIAKSKFRIEENDTSYDLFRKTQISLWHLYKKNINNILNKKIVRTKQSELIRKNRKREYFDKKSINQKKIDICSSEYEKIKRISLAFDFPEHEKAYIQHGNNTKLYITTMDLENNYNRQILKNIESILYMENSDKKIVKKIRQILTNKKDIL